MCVSRHGLFIKLANFTLSWHSRYYIDKRTWRQRVERLHQNWTPLLPSLVDAILAWKYNAPLPTHAPANDMADEPRADGDPTAESYDFSIPIIDIYSLTTVAHIPRSATSTSAAEALVLQGYLGASPQQPQLAVSIRTLELYRRIRMRKASFSVEAFSKVLCDLYGVSQVCDAL